MQYASINSEKFITQIHQPIPSIMKNITLIALLLLPIFAKSQPLNQILPVRGFSIAAPAPAQVDTFIAFIKDELIPRKVNTLLLRVDYRYQYESHPELNNETGLSEADVKKLVRVCQEGGIRIIPQFNLLGHQSWAENVNNLLRVYPQFDETPHIQMPEKYEWPNKDGLYCKSYCPLHPEVHGVVFDLIDELVEVFEADAFHAGMDEVFYIGDDQCPRCHGMDKAELFAREVTRIRNHLAQSNTELWIWGDRLIDGKATGIGMWEASTNDTHRAIDMIPKDVVICDWHYEQAVPTAVIFASKGFRVITCPWRLPDVTVKQLEMTLSFREHSPANMRENFMGMMQTIWTGAESYMDMFYGRKDSKERRGGDTVECFKRLFDEIGGL